MSKKIADGSYEDELRAELSRKLTLLMDVVANDQGSEVTYSDIANHLKESGISLSRPRWSYMLNGTGPLVTDPVLLKALAEYFKVPPAYLVPGSDSPMPKDIEAKLEAIRAIKHSNLKIVATRALGEVSPKTLAAITKLLNDHLDDEE